MTKELYHRFTEIYLPGQQQVTNNDEFSKLINEKILDFCKKKKVSTYRIINAETQVLPSTPFSESNMSTGFVMLVIHIAYTI